MKKICNYLKAAAVVSGCIATVVGLQESRFSGIYLIDTHMPKLQTGIVVEKQYEPPKKTYEMVPGPAIVPPVELLHNETYRITFASSNDGRVSARTVYVTKEDYDSMDLGQMFDIAIHPPIRPTVREFFMGKEVGK